MQPEDQFADWSTRRCEFKPMMDYCARESLCNSCVAKEALEIPSTIVTCSRRTGCDPIAFAFEAVSPPLPPRPVDAAMARAPRRCSTRLCASSLRRKRSNWGCCLRENLLAARLLCCRISSHVANGASMNVSPNTVSRRLHMPKEMA